jgi:signal transduction histidine kinase
VVAGNYWYAEDLSTFHTRKYLLIVVDIGYEHDYYWPNSWLTTIQEDYIPKVAALFSALAEKRQSINFEIALKKRWEGRDETTGEAFSRPAYIIAQASPQLIGKESFISGAVTDISRLKWAEDIQSQRRLEALEMKRQQENFMDITSHEIRNPLSAVLQCADSIVTTLSTYQAETPGYTKRTPSAIPGDSLGPALLSNDDPIAYAIEAAKVVKLCAQHQKRIVDDVLILAKVDANLVEIHPIDVQPHILAENTVKMFSSDLLVNKSHMRLEVDQSYKDLRINWVRMDSSRLLQVLINLCTNALRVMFEKF